jgi:hypothetical protein
MFICYLRHCNYRNKLINHQGATEMTKILTKKYAEKLIRLGKAERQYTPLARLTRERDLDLIYPLIRRDQPDGSVKFTHYQPY